MANKQRLPGWALKRCFQIPVAIFCKIVVLHAVSDLVNCIDAKKAFAESVSQVLWVKQSGASALATCKYCLAVWFLESSHDVNVNMFVQMYRVRGLPAGMPRKLVVVKLYSTYIRKAGELMPLHVSYLQAHLSTAEMVMSGRGSCQHTPVKQGQLVKGQAM